MVSLPFGPDRTGEYFPSYWFEPQLSTLDQLQMRACETFTIFNCMHALTVFLSKAPDGDAICEIAGGEARTTRVLIRQNDSRIRPGPNFDLVTDVDLAKPQEQQAFWSYRRQRKPKVCIMSPMRRSFGSWSHMNKVLNHDTWQQHYESVDKPLAQFCGQVALEQLEDEYDFVNEQPVGSSLYQETPWPQVLKHPRRRSVIFDQCQLGQRTTKR